MNNDKNLPEWKKVTIDPSDLNIYNVPKTAISAIFSEAESLLNEKGGITKVASTDETLTVKDKTIAQPFIVALTSRNGDFLTCKCKTLFGTIFMAVQLLRQVNWIFGLITSWRLEKSVEVMSGKKGLSISIDSDLSVKEKGREKNEIRKNSTTKQIEASNQAKYDHRQHFQENT